MADAPYRLTLDLSVIDHLGLNLYSSTPAVLSEVVANAWDADAEKVDIEFDEDGSRVTITDDGIGMDAADINQKYLTVGYRKRALDPILTPKHKRHVMGRKGIGKLSLFAIADTIEVHSVKKPKGSARSNKHGFIMRTADVKAAAEAGEDYLPEPVDSRSITIRKGTRIVLTDLNSRARTATERALRTRLARRFSIISPDYNFRVRVNRRAIGPEDRNYFPKLEYLWSIGDVGDKYESAARNAKRTDRIDGTIDQPKGWKVTGWVGTLDEQKSIEGEHNTVVLLAWGKLIQEDVLGEVQAGGLYTKYLMGELRADFLDDDDQPDITTSDRQRLKEDDPRYEQVLEWFRTSVLRVVEKSWGEWRGAAALDTALEIPEVKEWHGTLSPDAKKFAQQLFGRIGRLPKDRDSEKRELYKYTILAFEKLRFREALTNIESISEEPDFTLLQAVFDGLDELEAAQYHQIARGRLEVIEAFEDIVDTEKEKVIQKYLFDHLWLLHPSWERATGNARLEESVKKEFTKLNTKLSDPERRGRIDLRYQTAANKHIIIELKRYNASVETYELARQLQKYRSALAKVLSAKHPDDKREIEAIAIVGKPPGPAGMDPEERARVFDSGNARFITYDMLIREALDSYRDYLEANRKLSKISAIIDRLSEDEQSPPAKQSSDTSSKKGRRQKAST